MWCFEEMIGTLVCRFSHEDQPDWCGRNRPVYGGKQGPILYFLLELRHQFSSALHYQNSWFFKGVKHWDSHTVAMAVLGPHSSHWGIRLASFSFPALQVVIIPWAFSVSISVWAHNHSKSHVSYQFFPLENYVIYQLWFPIVPLVFSFLYGGWHNMQSFQAGFLPFTLYLRSIPHLYMAHFFLLLKDVPFKFDSTFSYWTHKVPLSWGD